MCIIDSKLDLVGFEISKRRTIYATFLFLAPDSSLGLIVNALLINCNFYEVLGISYIVTLLSSLGKSYPFYISAMSTCLGIINSVKMSKQNRQSCFRVSGIGMRHFPRLL